MPRMTIAVSEKLRDRIKEEAKRVRRFAMDEAADLIEDGFKFRAIDKKRGTK